MVFLSLEKMVKPTNTRETGSFLEKRYRRKLAELSRKKALRSLVEGIRECFSVRERQVYDRDVCTNLMKSGLVSGGFCLTLSHYDRSK